MKKCAACDLTKTYLEKDGYAHWRSHDNDWYCNTCYCKYIRVQDKEKITTYNRRKIRFMDTFIYLNENPRKGICELCGYQGLTHMHHEKYNIDNPLAHTIELCASCHAKQGHKLKQIGRGLLLTF